MPLVFIRKFFLFGFSLFSFRCTTRRIMANPEFPKTLEGFGYGFNENGKLRKLDPETGDLTNEPFEFNVSDDSDYNQKHYEALGEVINHYVYGLLEKEGLKRLPVPRNSNDPEELRTFIFASDDYVENEKLIVLIHGSGVVRAGQWARRLIINDNLNSGTQIPYVKRARELGYAVIVLNTNDNHRLVKGKQKEIKDSENPEKHMETAWNDYIKTSNVKHIAIIAHSYGGVCTVDFGIQNPEEVINKVFAIGFTDSVHAMPSKGVDHLIKVAKNWVSSEKPLDTPELSLSGDIVRVSSGHSVHEMTSWSCMESLFKYLTDQYKQATSKREEL